MPIRNKNIKLITNYVVGPLVFCLLALAIYFQVKKQDDWENSIRQIISTTNFWKICPVVLLMLINWGIEARKWQIALSPSTHLPFITSFKAVFSGTTMAFFTPNRIGEYLGRMIHLNRKDRINSISLTVLSSISQLLITLLAGTIGLIVLKKEISSHYPEKNVIFWINLLVYILIATTITLTIFYFRLGPLVKWIDRVPKLNKWIRHIRVLESFNATILFRLLSLSIIRYFVFIIQYFLLFNVFGIDLGWWQSFWSVSVVFVIIAIVPSVAVLTELGIRCNTSIEVLHLFSSNTAAILAVSLTIWIINLVIPALIGSLLIPGFKLFKTK